MAQDPYRVLGVAKSADAAAIKSAFRKLAKQHHPDTAGSDDKAKARAQSKFAEVNQAYEIIGDAKKRAKFDRGEIDADGTERAPFGGVGGGFGGGGFGGNGGFGGGGRARDPFGSGGASGGMGDGMGAEDILRQMFGGGASAGMGAGTGGRTRRQPPPAETHARAFISIADLLGTDKIEVDVGGGRKLAVAVPLGTRDGDTIRLRGQGQPDPYGQKGDLLIELTVRAEKDWAVRKNDLVGSFDVPLATAVAGGKTRARTPRGALTLTIEPWTNGGKNFRLKGKGLPAKKGSTDKAGDMVLTMNVVLPEDRPEALKTLLERLADN